MKLTATLLVSSLALAIGCERKSESANQETYEGHTLGETPMLWSVEENIGASDPLEVCREIVKNAVDPQSDNYKNCQKFVLTGDYNIAIADWKTLGRERHFMFIGWKLARIVIEEPIDVSTARNDLTKRFGAPVREGHWRGPDGAKIELIPRHDPEHQNTSIITVMPGQ